MDIKAGDTARLKITAPQGEVLRIKYDEDTGEKRALLSYVDGDGVEHERWFLAADLEKVAEE